MRITLVAATLASAAALALAAPPSADGHVSAVASVADESQQASSDTSSDTASGFQPSRRASASFTRRVTSQASRTTDDSNAFSSSSAWSAPTPPQLPPKIPHSGSLPKSKVLATPSDFGIQMQENTMDLPSIRTLQNLPLPKGLSGGCNLVWSQTTYELMTLEEIESGMYDDWYCPQSTHFEYGSEGDSNAETDIENEPGYTESTPELVHPRPVRVIPLADPAKQEAAAISESYEATIHDGKRTNYHHPLPVPPVPASHQLKKLPVHKHRPLPKTPVPLKDLAPYIAMDANGRVKRQKVPKHPHAKDVFQSPERSTGNWRECNTETCYEYLQQAVTAISNNDYFGVISKSDALAYPYTSYLLDSFSDFVVSGRYSSIKIRGFPRTTYNNKMTRLEENIAKERNVYERIHRNLKSTLARSDPRLRLYPGEYIANKGFDEPISEPYKHTPQDDPIFGYLAAPMDSRPYNTMQNELFKEKMCLEALVANKFMPMSYAKYIHVGDFCKKFTTIKYAEDKKTTVFKADAKLTTASEKYPVYTYLVGLHLLSLSVPRPICDAIRAT